MKISKEQHTRGNEEYPRTVMLWVSELAGLEGRNRVEIGIIFYSHFGLKEPRIEGDDDRTGDIDGENGVEYNRDLFCVVRTEQSTKINNPKTQ